MTEKQIVNLIIYSSLVIGGMTIMRNMAFKGIDKILKSEYEKQKKRMEES